MYEVMPVEVQQEQLEPCKVALDVQVPPEQFQQAGRVLGTIAMAVDGERVPEAGLDRPSWLQIGVNLPDFDAGLKGATAGSTQEFDFTYPEDFAIEERRGKEAHATVQVQK